MGDVVDGMSLPVADPRDAERRFARGVLVVVTVQNQDIVNRLV